MAGMMTIRIPDIHVAHSPAHVDQIHPRQNRDARQTKATITVALEHFYQDRPHEHAGSRRLVTERRKESGLVRYLPL